MNNEPQNADRMTSAEAADALNRTKQTGRYAPGAYVMTTQGHRLQVGRAGEFKPLNKSAERSRRQRQAEGRKG